jgi:NAD(P)H-dependent FMN reductase
VNPTSTKHLLIVYHSQSGRNERLAYAARAAAILELDVRLLRAAEAGTRDIEWCDGVLLFLPENFGALAGGLKEFFDRIFYPVIERQLIRPYGVFMACGNDGSASLVQLAKITRGCGWQPVTEAIICHGEPGEAEFEQAQELGEAFATGLILGMF